MRGAAVRVRDFFADAPGFVNGAQRFAYRESTKEPGGFETQARRGPAPVAPTVGAGQALHEAVATDGYPH